MEQVEARGEWHMFDPHEVREVNGLFTRRLLR